MSVLMSVYIKDNSRHLKQALESIYDSQTVKPNEIVVVFDGSLTKQQLKILRNFRKGKEEFVFYYPRKQNLGLGAALQFGLEKCTNEYIARMDSDDISCSDRFEKQLDYIEKHQNIDIISGNIQEFNKTINDKMTVRKVPIGQEEIISFSKRRNPFNHMAVVFRKESVLKAGGYTEDFHLFEDYYLWVRMLMNGCIANNIDEILVYARSDDNIYIRRGGKEYAKNLLRFHKWMLNNHWISYKDYILSSIPHAIICVLPKTARKQVYKRLRK